MSSDTNNTGNGTDEHGGVIDEVIASGTPVPGRPCRISLRLLFLYDVFDFFRLRHSDQRTVAGLLTIAVVLLCGYTVMHKRETLEPKQYTYRIDLNTVTHGELQTLPGIGPKLAENIIRYRDEHAPIHDFDEIMNVSGIGIKKYNTMKPYFID